MPNTVEGVRVSKTLSYWLRHRPAAGSLILDEQGWADVDAVLAALERTGLAEARDKLGSVLATNDKQRFELSSDESRIRARQGHSVPVRLDWPVRTPPELLYHGTVERALPAILEQGLRPMRRHYNTVRPHSSLGYRPPAPEAATPPLPASGSASLHLRPAMAAKATMH